MTMSAATAILVVVSATLVIAALVMMSILSLSARFVSRVSPDRTMRVE